MCAGCRVTALSNGGSWRLKELTLLPVALNSSTCSSHQVIAPTCQNVPVPMAPCSRRW